jgi:hypothetical protein
MSTTIEDKPAPLPAPTVLHNDGFDAPDEDAGSGIIQGTKLKFSNSAAWLDDNDDVIAKDRQFIGSKIIKVVQMWLLDPKTQKLKPAETRILPPDQLFPDIDHMNAEAPPEQWREHFGTKKGPWEKSLVLYLLDPKNMRGFTYVASSFGGMRAVSDLKADTQRARLLHGANVYPLLTLGDVFMPTQFGGRQRPCFNVVKFIPIGAAPAQPQLAKPEKSKNNDLDDSIPF